MRWVKCEPNVELVGEREGHCAVVLAVTHPGAETNTAQGRQYIVVFGGYCEGELTGEPIISPVEELPRLRWDQLRHQSVLECDGASLTATDAAREGLLFGGLDAELERRNALFSVTLCRTSAPIMAGERQDVDGAALPTLVVTPVPTTGEIPAPRSRHGAGFSQGQLYIFGGETDAVEQNNDLFVFTRETGVWRRVGGGTDSGSLHRSLPSPRLLCLSLVFVTPTIMVMYGGCHFTQGRLESLNDVWVFYVAEQRWSRLGASPSPAGAADPPAEGAWPRSNGHRGCRVSSSAAFIGGKDASTGDDRVKLVRYAADLDAFKFSFATPEEAASGSSGEAAEAEAEEEEEEEELVVNSRLAHPHWRYTPAVVEVPVGLLVIGGQCRHPQRPSVYLLHL